MKNYNKKRIIEIFLNYGLYHKFISNLGENIVSEAESIYKAESEIDRLSKTVAEIHPELADAIENDIENQTVAKAASNTESEKVDAQAIEDLNIYGIEDFNKNISKDIALCNLLMNQLTEYEKQLVKHRYFQGIGVNKICEKFYISQSTFFRKTSKIISKLEKYINEFEGIF